MKLSKTPSQTNLNYLPHLVEWGIVLLAIGYFLSASTSIILNIDSRPVNIAYRGIVVLLFFIPFVFTPLLNTKIVWSEFLLISFWLLYLARITYNIFIDGLTYNNLFNTGLTTGFIYLLTILNILLPLFVVFRYRIHIQLNRLFANIVLSIFICSFLVTYSVVTSEQYINRLLYARFSLGAEGATLNPIRISFIGFIGSFTGIFLLLYTKLNFYKNILVIALIGTSIFNLVIGASRGPFLLTIITIAILLFIKLQVKTTLSNKLKIISILLLSSLFISYYFFKNSDSFIIFERITNTLDRIEEGEKEERNYLLQIGWNQFLDSPIIGSSFITISDDPNLDRVIPHNFLLESLMAVGCIGSIFLFWPIFKFLKKIIFILNFPPKVVYFLLLTFGFFLQTLISGSLFLDVEFWVLFCLCLTFMINKRKKPQLTS